MVDTIGGHRIVDAVAEASGVSRAELTGRKRTAAVAVPRQLAMFLMDELSPHMSTPMMARALRRKDHTTILHGIRRWRNQLRQQPQHYELEQRARALLGGAAQPDTEAAAGHGAPSPLGHDLTQLPYTARVAASVTFSGAFLSLSCASEASGCGRTGEALHGRLPPQTSPAGTPKPAGASSGKNASAGKAKGGRMSARSARSYYAAFGGRRGDHERAKHAAAQSRAPGTCMACDNAADIDASGLCASCASIVQRADAPAAAYGGEPGNLSRTSGGTEADNIVTSG
jgi:hypothetical protein